MSKFNLKNYQKINGDDHIDRRLKEDHGGVPNEVGEAQLEGYRATEEDVITEKLLEKKRLGGDEEVTERRLDKNKPKFANKYRNPSAYNGDINKLEEQRLLGDRAEDEKYSDASETPKPQRWWENVKSPDGLKVAKTKKSVKTAQTAVLEELLGTEEESEKEIIPPEWAAVNPKEADDFDVIEEPAVEELKTIEEGDDFEIEESSPEENIYFDKVKFIGGKVPGVYMVLAYDVTDFGGVMEDIQEAALNAVITKYKGLAGLISIDDFSTPQESGREGKMILRAAGDQFASVIENNDIQNDQAAESLSMLGGGAGEELPGSDLFDEITYKEENVGGTSMAIGKIKVNTVVTDENRNEIISQAIAYLSDEHPDLEVREESLDLANIDNEEIGFMASMSLEDVVASTKNIVQKSQNLKKK